MKWILGFVLVVIYIFIPKISVQAQQETTISVAPAVLDLAVQPGENAVATLMIRNGGQQALPISVLPQSLLQEDEIIPNNSLEISDASSWITSEDSEFLLASKEAKKVNLEINVPNDATPGGHYAQISIRGLSLESDLESGASIVVPEIAVTVLISVKGEVITNMQFKKNNIIPTFVTPGTKYLANFSIVNNGNIHDLVRPVFIVSQENIEIYRQNLSSKIVLPQTVKQFSETIQLPDDYGVYDVHIEFQYANGQKTVSTVPEKLIVSRPLPLIILEGISIILFLYLYNHRHNIKKAWIELIK